MGSRFVQPEEVTLPISDGDTLTVKKWLSEGERRAAYSRMYRQNGDGVNPEEVWMAMVVAYLLDWTLTNGDGSKVTIRGKSASDLASILDNLHPDDFAEIRNAIRDHETAQAKARQEKKPPSGVTEPEMTSISVA